MSATVDSPLTYKTVNKPRVTPGVKSFFLQIRSLIGWLILVRHLFLVLQLPCQSEVTSTPLLVFTTDDDLQRSVLCRQLTVELTHEREEGT